MSKNDVLMAQETGPLSLFLGVQTARWTRQQFLDAAHFGRAHGVSTLFIKVYEVGSYAGTGPASGVEGVWYGGVDGWDSIYRSLQPIINVIPYGFLYGRNMRAELNTARTLLDRYKKLCLDMEGGYWAGGDSATRARDIARVLGPIRGKLWVSCPADPIRNNQLGFLQAIAPAVDAFMPMAYSNELATTWKHDFERIKPGACIQPTLDLSQEFGGNNVLGVADSFIHNGALAISCWEYGFATSNPGLLNSIREIMKAVKVSVPAPPPAPTTPSVGPGPLLLNSQGMVLDVPYSNQEEPGGDSPDLCGPWSVASLRVAGLPNKGARGNAEDIDVWTDHEVDKYMPDGHQKWPGASIPDMYNFLKDSRDPHSGVPNLHFWDIPPGIPTIRNALRAGYPVLVTASGGAGNIVSKKTGKPPYPWNMNANHIFPLMGIDKDGDFIVADELNARYQGVWPVVYLADRLHPSWACVVQVTGPDEKDPWLAPIPSGNPDEWASKYGKDGHFNAQRWVYTPPVPGPAPTNSETQTLAAHTLWHSVRSETPIDTGIYRYWMEHYKKGVFFGAPLSGEWESVSWGGNPIVCQTFTGGSIQWDGTAHWYPDTR